MKKIDFNRNWTCRCLTRDEEPYSVTLPHDAMRSEPRTGESVSEGNYLNEKLNSSCGLSQ